jgi:hypothetical protein
VLKSDWQPEAFAQCAEELPQYPALEQHMLKLLPVHVRRLLPLQVPSVEIVPAALEQVPNEDWQPAVQWPVVLPQYPEDKQQFPNVVPVHVIPLLPPQVPSGDMLLAVQLPIAI